MIWKVDEILAELAKLFTLAAGDLIFTGTPGKTDVLKPGDVAEVELEGAGTLTNPVIAEGAIG